MSERELLTSTTTLDAARARVVVAVSDSPSGQAALRYAVGEAVRRNASLHLVRVWREIGRLYSLSRSEASRLHADERAEEAVLAHAVDRARSIAPELAVVFDFIPGDLYRALEAAARGADLVVVGAGSPEHSSYLIGRWCERHLHVPVSVVPAPTDAPIVQTAS